MAWFKKDKTPIVPIGDRTVKTEGLWIKCDQCKQIIWKKDLQTNLNVCPQCNYHFKISAQERLRQLFDDGRFREFDREMQSTDPLGFVDKKSYKQRLREMHAATGLRDAIITAEGKIDGRSVCVCAMESGFISGSMGSVVGEKITRAIERCLSNACP